MSALDVDVVNEKKEEREEKKKKIPKRAIGDARRWSEECKKLSHLKRSVHEVRRADVMVDER